MSCFDGVVWLLRVGVMDVGLWRSLVAGVNTVFVVVVDPAVGLMLYKHLPPSNRK